MLTFNGTGYEFPFTRTKICDRTKIGAALDVMFSIDCCDNSDNYFMVA
jgi:hypothetical protein